MGCDIHMYAEYLGEDRKTWHPFGPRGPQEVYDEEKDTYTVVEDVLGRIYSDRNYFLFGILAGVRYSPSTPPIAPDRGVPEDSCDEIQNHRSDWSGDGHSHTHCTLTELLAYDWTQTIEEREQILFADYNIWVNVFDRSPDEMPRPWYMSRHKPEDTADIKESFQNEFEAILERVAHLYSQRKGEEARAILDQFQPARAWCDFHVPFYQRADKFWKTTMPKLARAMQLTPDKSPDQVRIVFWFDN